MEHVEKKIKISYLKFTKVKMTKPELNSLLNNVPKQRVEYMKHIPFPPTRTIGVKETNVQSKRVSKECGSTFAFIQYDLAIAIIPKKV